MSANKRRLFALLVAGLMCGIALGIHAQSASAGTLEVGKPLPAQITAGATLNYDLILTEPSQVSLQALSDTGLPTITILSSGATVAQELNSSSSLTITLSALLNAGSYVVQIGTANNTSGLVVLVLQSESPVTTTALILATPASGIVDSAAPLALYSFRALTEPAFLYVRGASPDGGINVRLVDTTSGGVSGQFGADLIGARFQIPAGTAAYQVEVQDAGTGSPQMFTVCLAAVNAGGCETGAVVPQPQPTTAPPPTIAPPAATPELTPQGCTVTPSVAGGVNIRQSASTASLLVGTLPTGAIANVIGISPDGQFYNVLYNGSNGWIALSVVQEQRRLQHHSHHQPAADHPRARRSNASARSAADPGAATPAERSLPDHDFRVRSKSTRRPTPATITSSIRCSRAIN